MEPEDNENEENQLNCDFPDFESKVSETEYIGEDLSKNKPHDSFVELKSIIYTSDTVEIKTYICDYCGQQFNKKSYLGSHMIKHKNELVPKERKTHFPCNVQRCKKVYKVKKSLVDHQLKVHGIDIGPSERKLCCPQCPKSFPIQYKLDAHIRKKHEGLKVVGCCTLY